MPRAPFGAGSTAVNKIDTVGFNAVCGFTREAAATVTAAAKEISDYRRVSYDYEGYKGKQYNSMYRPEFWKRHSNSLVTIKSIW